MTRSERPALAAVDIGNSRIKVGLYLTSDLARTPANELPKPERTFDLVPGADRFERLVDLLSPHQPAELAWWIGSVERSFASQLVDWLRTSRATQLVMLTCGDLPLAVSLPRPDMVGIDRLLAALAVNRLRPADKPAVIVDLGTAITVDLVSAEGAFLGGAILPGIAMAARSLHEFTDLLPRIEMSALAEPPVALGTGTEAAMRSGIYWGAVGGIRQLIELLAATAGGEPQVYLTGGAAPVMADLIGPRGQIAAAAYLPHLMLSGIALAASE